MQLSGSFSLFKKMVLRADMPLPYPTPLSLPHLSLRFHDLHLVLIFCSILPDVSIHTSRDNHSPTPLYLLHYTIHVVSQLILSCSEHPVFYWMYSSVKIILGLSLLSVFNLFYPQHQLRRANNLNQKTCPITRT